MKRRRATVFLGGAIVVLLAAGLAAAQVAAPPSTQEQRLSQVIDALEAAPSSGATEAALDDAMEILYGGMRPLPTPGPSDADEGAHNQASQAEMDFAEALELLATHPDASPPTQQRALKETRGLLVRLRFEKIALSRYPFTASFTVPRTNLDDGPIWTLEWIPAQYVKEWRFCNSSGQIASTVGQRVVEDTALNFFWRYFA